MKVWFCTQFNGHWPVGTAAVVVADTAMQACYLLETELVKVGLSQKLQPDWFERIDTSKPNALILLDGNY